MIHTSIEKESIELLQKIIKLNTTNEYANEEIAAYFLKEVLQKEDIDSQIIYSPEGRANFVAKLNGRSNEAPLVLLSHVDVVAAKEEEWTCPPFSGQIFDNKLWGRGTLDTKQLTIMHLIAFMQLKRNNRQLRRDVYFIATADEENGSKQGMEFLAQKHPEFFQGATVLSEGGGFTITGNQGNHLLFASGEKGTARILVTAIGDAENQAIVKLSAVLQELMNYKFDATEYEIQSLYSAGFIEKLKSSAKTEDTKLVHQLYEYISLPTAMVEWMGAIPETGGETIPTKAQALIEIRTLPYQNEEFSKEMFSNFFSHFDVDWKLLFFQKGYESNVNSVILQLFKDQSSKYGVEANWIPFTALGKTDGRFIGELANDIYGLSPTKIPFTEVLKRVHNKDECIELDSFLYGVSLMIDVVERFCDHSGGG
ncbi:M20/M25/M40 family metallo-hydrolase [Bacillus salitolerans]|uniref:M20/M25/M40 family metallo-hydrolase n=1 Tax=Bacillus salitolerans TaxID=1437434 RepID=A0ABW4LWM4_9BACI